MRVIFLNNTTPLIKQNLGVDRGEAYIQIGAQRWAQVVSPQVLRLLVLGLLQSASVLFGALWSSLSLSARYRFGIDLFEHSFELGVVILGLVFLCVSVLYFRSLNIRAGPLP